MIIGSKAVVSQLVPVDLQNIKHVNILPSLHDSVTGHWLRPPGNCPVLDLCGLSVALHVLPPTVTVLSGRTSQTVMVKYQDTTSRQALHTNQPYLKGNRPVVNITDHTWTLPIKMGSLPVFTSRVGNISAGQAGSTSRQVVNNKCVEQASLTDLKLLCYEIYDYIRQVGLCNASFGIWPLTDVTGGNQRTAATQRAANFFPMG